MRRIVNQFRPLKRRKASLDIVGNPEFHNSKGVAVLKSRNHYRDALVLREADAGCGALAI
jgi:hypothetical protein